MGTVGSMAMTRCSWICGCGGMRITTVSRNPVSLHRRWRLAWTGSRLITDEPIVGTDLEISSDTVRRPMVLRRCISADGRAMCSWSANEFRRAPQVGKRRRVWSQEWCRPLPRESAARGLLRTRRTRDALSEGGRACNLSATCLHALSRQCTVYGSLSVKGAISASNVSPARVTIWSSSA